METHKSLWPLLVILILSIAIASFFWYPRSADAPSSLDDEEKSVMEEKGESATPQKPAVVPASDAGKRFFEDGSFITIVEYTSKGFNPTPVTITAGEEVRFVNKSGGTMKITSDSKKSSREYAEYRQPTTVGYGGVFQLLLPVSGLWTYQNVNVQPPVVGVINVK